MEINLDDDLNNQAKMVDDFMDNGDIDTLLSQLSSGYPKHPEPIKEPEVELTEDDLEKFILKKSSALIDLSLDSVKDLKDFITSGQNPDEISALASLITSTTGAIESLNKLHLLRKKHEMTKEIKALDFANKKEIVKALPAGNNITNNTQVIVASREEIIKQMMGIPIEEPEMIVITNEIISE